MKTATVSARVTLDVDDKLTRLSESTHRSKSYLAAQAIKAFVSDQYWQIEAIMEGIKEADEGKFVTEKQMKKSLKKWGIDAD